MDGSGELFPLRFKQKKSRPGDAGTGEFQVPAMLARG
jgi:hypothetical protein